MPGSGLEDPEEGEVEAGELEGEELRSGSGAEERTAVPRGGEAAGVVGVEVGEEVGSAIAREPVDGDQSRFHHHRRLRLSSGEGDRLREIGASQVPFELNSRLPRSGAPRWGPPCNLAHQACDQVGTHIPSLVWPPEVISSSQSRRRQTGEDLGISISLSSPFVRRRREPQMEAHIQTFLNRLSLFSIILGTALLLRLFLLSPHSCPTPSTTTASSSSSSFPTTSCSPSIHHRPYLPLTNQTNRLLKSRSRSHYPSLFLDLSLNLPFSFNDSKSLLLSAAPGFSYLALRGLGAGDVTAVDVVDSPPYVSRADPHNLPFFDGVFDLAFTDGLDQALFPRRYVSEMERVVRKGGVCVVALEEEVGEGVVREVVGLFHSGKVAQGDAGVRNVTVAGFSLTRIVLRIG